MADDILVTAVRCMMGQWDGAMAGIKDEERADGVEMKRESDRKLASRTGGGHLDMGDQLTLPFPITLLRRTSISRAINMPRAEAGTAKAIGNAIKAKGGSPFSGCVNIATIADLVPPRPRSASMVLSSVSEAMPR